VAVWELDSAEALQALASRLAAFVSERDFIALTGDLGAGKTTFAQGLLAALGVDEAVTSPTYQIIHAYTTPRRTVYHCDLYRLHPGDEEEIGFAELCETGAVLVEWPDIVAGALPDDRLEVRIEGEGSTRRVSLAGFGAWEQKLARFREIEAFLRASGWDGARCVALRGDASARQFLRLTRHRETAMLMDWPTQSDGPPIRDGRPYCAIAHLAREGTPFIAISAWLRESAGLSAPTVTASDKEAGLYLVEDLGDAVFGDLIAQGEALKPLYTLAVDGLSAIRASGVPRSLPLPGGGIYDVPAFDREAMEVELDLLPQWYFKLQPIGAAATDALSRSFFEAWSPHLAWLDTQPKTIALRDYHSPNLLLCRERDDLKRLGVIDFQDAVWAHPAYDLVSLLQDARLDVPEAVERSLYARYSEAAAAADPAFDAAAFARAYAILGAERNTKILGIFARLSLRDGKHGYLAHLPRIRGYLWRNLAHPDLADLNAWYEAHLGGV